MIVIDPRRTETAELADFHLAVRPGTDAWCLAALVAVLVQEGLVDDAWLAEHATGVDEVGARASRASPSPTYCRDRGVDEDAAARGGPAHRRRRRASRCSRTSACR